MSLAVALGLTLALSLAGFVPGYDATITFTDGTAYAAGPFLHGAAFLLALLLICYMPANWRMRRLEAGHRNFRIGMEDVARAYEVAHVADRKGIFTYASEYDAVRERLTFLAEHPDLGHLEPEILEVAAQMSRTSEDLARVYCDEAVARARGFLAKRHAEAERMEARIEKGLAACRELRQLNERVSMEEDVAASRLNQLRAELDTVLPELGLAPPRPANQPEVIQLAEHIWSKGTVAE